jgi:hypothetical protein
VTFVIKQIAKDAIRTNIAEIAERLPLLSNLYRRSIGNIIPIGIDKATKHFINRAYKFRRRIKTLRSLVFAWVMNELW